MTDISLDDLYAGRISDEKRIVVARLAISEGLASLSKDVDFTACRLQYGVTSGGVPFHRAAKAGVKIRFTFREKAEFQ